jgi:hypothetical protein
MYMRLNRMAVAIVYFTLVVLLSFCSQARNIWSRDIRRNVIGVYLLHLSSL